MNFFQNLITEEVMTSLIQTLEKSGIKFNEKGPFRKDIHLRIKSSTVNR